MKVAILGANGFVGYHLFEAWQERAVLGEAGAFAPRAIVRAPARLARIARFGDADWRLADAMDREALAEAFAGCEAVVHCALGDDRVIEGSLQPVYEASKRAGVRKIVYLSTGSVHGQSPPPGTNEDSPISDRQIFGYNNAKVRAERNLRRLASDQGVETALLRPGIIFGPRSGRMVELAEALEAGRGWWIGEGKGVCNSIYLDNLVHAIERAIVTPGLHGDVFLVGDAETATWRDLYAGIAAGLGYDPDSFIEAEPAGAQTAGEGGLHKLKSLAVERIRGAMTPRMRGTIRSALDRWNRPPPPDPWSLPTGEPWKPEASLEMTLLFNCATKLPSTKAAAVLGYRPPVSFSEGVRRTAAWLLQAGYAPGPGR